MLIESKAKAAGLSVSNYVRSMLGLPERAAGRQTRQQMAAHRHHAWQQSMGIDAAQYFPADESWLTYRTKVPGGWTLLNEPC